MACVVLMFLHLPPTTFIPILPPPSFTPHGYTAQKIVDVQPVKEKNRRGANVYRIIDAPKASTSTSQPHTDGSSSPPKRMKSLSPALGNDAGNDETPPTKKMKRKTKV